MTDSIDGLSELEKRFAAITDFHMFLGRLGLQAVSYAKEFVPRKTGNLGRTIRLGTVTDEYAQIIAGGQFGVGYAQAVEFGTRAHVIVPVRRKALAWGGSRRLSGSLRSGAKATNFAMRVNHPGTQAKPYLGPAAAKVVEENAVAGIVTAWNTAA
jgi:hypothetical protein